MKKIYLTIFSMIAFFAISYVMYAQTPVAYWKFDENSGTTTKEEISNLTSTITDNTSNPFAPSYLPCFINGMDFTKFNSVTGCVKVTTYEPLEFTTGSFSISAFVQINKTITTEQDIVAKGWRSAAVDGHWYALYISSGATKKYTFAVDDNYDATVPGTPGKTSLTYTIPADQTGWVHLVAVRNVTTDFLYLYVNGLKVAELADATNQSIASPNYPLIIGNTNEGNSLYGGIIDEVKIFNVALSETEILNLYNNNCIGIKNKVLSENMEIYPNPATEKIIFKNAYYKSIVKIYNIQGKLVKMVHISSGQKDINVNELKKGLYYINIVNTQNKVLLKGSFVKD